MATPYDKYLSRLQKQKLSNAQDASFARGVSAMTTTNKYASDAMSGMRLGNVSASARAASLQQALQRTNEGLADLTSTKMQSDQQRNERLNLAIGEIETKREEYLRQQKQAEKQKERGLMQTIGQVGGAVAGALLAIPTGGMSMLSGSAIGSGLGSIAGSLINAGLPQDYAGAVQGVSDAFSAYSNYANEMKTKSTLNAVSQNMGILAQLPASTQANAFNTINMMISSGANSEEITKFMNSLAPTQQPTSLPMEGEIDLSTYNNPYMGGM